MTVRQHITTNSRNQFMRSWLQARARQQASNDDVAAREWKRLAAKRGS